jgi:ubiquinone/menaquinone biosynthesis C-methylase UbiE
MKNRLFGNEIERMPDFVFSLMKVFFRVYYFLKPPKKYIQKFGIRPGFTVVDYGCGPGAFIRDTSLLVGDNGKVYAADIHEMAIEAVEKIIQKHSLKNVTAVLTGSSGSAIPSDAADLIYALDMFHMVADTNTFLGELHRIIKKDGVLILEDGHQPRSLTKEKVDKSGFWRIAGEEKRFLRCTPIKV